ncbi:FliH/SctL family protein [Microbacterium sp. 179-I 3D2 NHS]|uniref:FliH/SctL family protein n=1 Tax=Microbacterium sp. 179-I 3D2 NHS TaxID=3235178 RepID=UPI0039A0F44D
MSTEAFSPVEFPRLGALGPALDDEYARARIRGYADGHAEGYRVAAAEASAAARVADEARRAREAASERAVQDAVDALQAAARGFAAREGELVAAAEEEVLRRAVDLAEVVLAGELSDPGASAAAAARRALAAAHAPRARNVRLHPGDLRTLEQRAEPLDGLALVADDSLRPGDAIVVLDHGHIDARVAHAIARARAALDGATS